MQNPPELKYASSHEWVRQETDGSVTVGITYYAQDHMGELVYVELPAIGSQLTAGNACAVVESTKTAADVYAPVSGTVIAVNDALSDSPSTVNQAPFSEGWLFKIQLPDSAVAKTLGLNDGLMSAEAYSGVIANAE